MTSHLFRTVAVTLWVFIQGLNAQPPADQTFHWGVNGHPVSQESYFHVPITNQLDLISELGAGWYRFDLGARAFAGNTARLDEMLLEAERRKLRLLPVLFSSPGARAKQATPVEIRSAAAAFARAVVSRYKGRITHWELNNELDAYALIRKGETNRKGKMWALTWGDPEGSDPDTYHEGRYAQAKAEILGLYEGVKAADPTAQTIVDTAGWLHYGFIERLVNEDRVPFDILAWHWYSEMGDITNVQGKRDLVQYLLRYQKPLWITEINRRDGSKGGQEKEAAAYVSQSATQLSRNSAVKSYFIYELLDEPYFGREGESDYGLVEVARDSNGKWQVKRKKASFDAYRSVIAAQQTRRKSSAAKDSKTSEHHSEPQLGVYRWANGTINVDAFANWLGRPVVWGLDFIGSETWDSVAWPIWWLKTWSEWKQQKPGRRFILSVPLLPGSWDGSGPKQGTGQGQPVSLEQGARGAYNHYFKTLAENLVAHQLGDTILRLGWEFNGGWYTWRANGKEQAFAEYWRQIVKTMRAVPGGDEFKFCWNPAQGYQQFPAEKAWPGDEFVDFVGLDVYDESWQLNTYPFPAEASDAERDARRKKVWDEVLFSGNHGLAFWSQFAREHRKPLSIPEWGVNDRPDQHGGLDNPYFVRQMHRFIMDPTNNMTFHCYFDVQAPDGHHQLSPGLQGMEKTEFPKAAAVFKELFGAQK